MSGATDRRPLGAEADPHVAGMSRRRDRRAGQNQRNSTQAGVRRRGESFPPCWRTSTCTGSRSSSTARDGPGSLGQRPSSCGTPMTSWCWRAINPDDWSTGSRGLLEGRFRLTINREKTRIVKLHEPGESLNFLGFTLRYDRDRFGGPSLPQRDSFGRRRWPEPATRCGS